MKFKLVFPKEITIHFFRVILCLNNEFFSKTCIGHVLYKTSLDKRKRGPFEIVIIKYVIKSEIFYCFSESLKIEDL